MTRTPPPSRRRLLAEAQIAWPWLRGRLAWRGLADAHRAAGHGRGRPVMVLPGFLADDHRTITLRRMLARAGYRVEGWGYGRNLGFREDLLERMAARLDAVGDGRPVALVGWSLGGVFARELAKYAPTKVERVVTLGSPFSADLRANHAWRAYERVAGHPIDRLPPGIVLADKPPVPTTAIWSPRDGIVAAAAARGLPGERDQAVEVAATHLGLVVDPRALSAILAALV